jgi:hypothetical protein
VPGVSPAPPAPAPGGAPASASSHSFEATGVSCSPNGPMTAPSYARARTRREHGSRRDERSGHAPEADRRRSRLPRLALAHPRHFRHRR